MSNLLKDNKLLMKEYDFEKNSNIDINKITIGSEKKVWWKCEKGHEWEAIIYNRKKGNGCPYCSNQKVLKSYNDLATTNPELIKEWNYEKNYPLQPSNVVAGSDKKVWWKCEKGHEWQTRISHRKKGSNCPYCANQKLLVGYNDLETTNPILVKEWNYEKNKFGPETVMEHSNKKVWWKCEKGHEWEQGPNVRASGCGCPYCAGKKLLVGYNDLKTTNPRLAKEWNYEKNKFGPETVMEYSNKKAWWKCEKGHEWRANINSRGSGVNCPICSKEFKTSFPEKVIYFYIKKAYADALENYRDKFIDNKEIDIYIPSKKIGIEYDGDYWHTDARDKEKDILCKTIGIELYRIREPKCKILKTSNCIMLKNRSLKELERAINYLINVILANKLDINIERDKNNIYELMNYQEKKSSLSEKCPFLIEEWDYDKNYPLLPSQVKYGSNKKVWWVCSNCGYNWETKISHRYSGHNCPRCCRNSIEIEQYDLKMNLLKKYKSIANAERETGIQHIKDALSGRRKTAGGYIWKYKDKVNTIDKLSNQVHPNSKKILQYDLHMKLIKEYNSIASAERENNSTHIKDVLSGRRKTAGGYIWKYKEEINEFRNN